MDATFDELRKKGKKTEKEVESMKKLAREVQAAVLYKKLEPGELHSLHSTSSAAECRIFVVSQSFERSTIEPLSNFLEMLEFVSRSTLSSL